MFRYLWDHYRDQAAIPADSLDALTTLWARYSSQGRHQLQALGPATAVAPRFKDAYATGDIVLGNTLVDIKVVIDPEPQVEEWLDRLLGYMLLDRDDRYGIQHLAIYLGWHAQALSVPVRDLASDSTGAMQLDLAALRIAFDTVSAPEVEKSYFYKYGSTRPDLSAGPHTS